MEQIIITNNQTGAKTKLFTKEPFCTVKSATQEKNLMGDDTIKLSIVSSQLLNFGKGDYITIDGEVYTVRTPATRQIISDKYYQYDVTLYGVMYELMKCLYRNTDANGRSSKSSFDLTYSLKDFAKVIINNMNRDYPGKWVLDEENVPETEPKTINFANQNCLQVLQTICSDKNFNFDFQITQADGVNTIHIGKFGSVIAPPGGGTAFEWGKGKGIYQLKEEKVDDKAIKTRLWVEGGTSNIKAGYRDFSDRLQLPYPKRLNKNEHTLRDGTTIQAKSQQIGIADDAKRYHEDAALAAKIGTDEEYKSYDEICPKRTGSITALVDGDIYSFVDNSMDFDLNEKDADGNTKYLISGVSAKITFISGKLAGQEFEIKDKGYDHSKKQFTIIPYQDERGQKFPTDGNTAFQFAVGDKYKLTEINPPQSVLDDAEEELWYESLQDFNDMKQARVKYTLTLDRLYMINNTPTAATVVLFKTGDYVHVKDSRFGIDKNIRVTKVSRNLLLRQDYSITLSDTVTISVAAQTVIDVIEHENIIEANRLRDLTKARKAWRTTEELRNMVYDTDGYFDPENIKPNSIDTNMLTVGSKSQQFILSGVILEANKGGNANIFNATGGVLTHLTINSDSVRNWTLQEAQFTLANTNGYYLFAKCSKTANTGVWFVSQDKLLVENASDPDNYYFQVGILSAVYADDGFRDFVSTYGFTRINGNTITTGKIVTSDGENYLDLDGNKFRIGDSTSSVDWNVTAQNQLTLHNVRLLSDSGDTAPIGVYRGVYNAAYTYYYGDEVSYTSGGATKTYRHTNKTATKGIPPTNTTYWNVIAQGANGQNGQDGKDGQPGQDGQPGADGKDGKDGTTYYTWIKYADDASGSGISDSPVGKDYIGFAYNKITPAESINPKDYDWVLFKGTDGTDGLPGRPGADGKTYYTWIKYSDVANPTSSSQIYDTPKETTEYIGIAVNQTSQTESTDPSKYTWSKFKGDQGVAGIYIQVAPTTVVAKKSSAAKRYEVEIMLFDNGTAVEYGSEDDNFLCSVLSSSSVITENLTWSFTSSGTLFKYRLTLRADKTENVDIPFTVTYKEKQYAFSIKFTTVEDGDTGDYFEYRYAVNGSTSTPPSLATTSRTPSGWSTTQPTVGSLQYLWRTMAKISGANETLLQDWSTPVRVTPYNGVDGADGTDGRDGKDGASYNPNILRSADFSDLSQWMHHNGNVLADAMDGVSGFYGKYDSDADPTARGYIELAQQLLVKTGTDSFARLNPSTWYTLSFWAKKSVDMITINETSNKYGFASKQCNLQAGVAYKIGIYGKISTVAKNAGKRLVVYIYKKDWSWSHSVSIDSTTVSWGYISFNDAPTTGAYEIQAYLYDNTRPSGVDVGTATVSYYQIERGGQLNTYLYPSLVDTAADYIVDGLKVASKPGDGCVTWRLTTAWEKHTVTFKTRSYIAGSDQYVLFRLTLMSDTTYICMPKLERGTEASAFGMNNRDLVGSSPALVYRGDYKADQTYYGTNARVDAVKYQGVYYVARVDAGSFSNIVPTDSRKWNTFGAQFESIATSLLLAENANIANWIFRDGMLYSQTGDCYLNGITGEISTTGLIRKKMLHITSQNISQYTETHDQGTVYEQTIINWHKAGSLITVDYFPDNYICYLPSIYPSANKYTEENANLARSYVGSTMIIYNKSGRSIAVSGRCAETDDNRGVSIVIGSGQMCVFQCKVTFDSSGREDVYWLYKKGTPMS